jgi:ubiquinone/menaquinone biosynthesis C-methylase UbiE
MNNTKFKFTNIAHKNHLFCSPIDSTKLDKLLKIPDLKSDSKVIDIGSGKSEILIRLVELYNLNSYGIDLNSIWLNEALEKSKSRIPEDKLFLYEMDIKEFSYDANSFDLAICTGSTHAYGSFSIAINEMKKLVRKDGYLLLAEGFWKKSPEQGYLDFLGTDSTEFSTLDGLIDKAEESELIPLYSCVSSNDDFDYYEGLYKLSMEKYLKENPSDPDSQWMKEKIRKWNHAYYKWGRDTLGFALILFQV